MKYESVASPKPLAADLLFGLLLVCLSAPAVSAQEALPGCPEAPATETEGPRRLALVVGVGRYESPHVRNLPGPSRDALRFYDLLTGPNGYGFPKENVCLLLDEEATAEAFRDAFRQRLVSRAKPGDVAVLYFGGHGSSTPDSNGDEPDGRDETLLFHDARVRPGGEMVDDELNALLAALHRKTRNVTLVLDSCESGSANRGGEIFSSRHQPPAEPGMVSRQPGTGGDASPGWVPEDLPGLVFFAAAKDGTPALEINGRGVFTDALIEVFGQVGPRPLTYAQAARQIPPLVWGRSHQVPLFHGELTREVFGAAERARPLAWEVRSLEPALELAGPPLLGIGVEAEFRIYDGSAPVAELRDPRHAKATVVVTGFSGLNALARVVARGPGKEAIGLGDLALLVRPGSDMVKVSVVFRDPSKQGGIPEDRAGAVRCAIRDNPESRMLVEIAAERAEFELALAPDGRIQLLGPTGGALNAYARAGEPQAIAKSLWQHARAKAFLNLVGEVGADFVDGETLKVRAVPTDRQTPCARGAWVQAEANQPQAVPLCHRWNVEVTLEKSSPHPLLIGGVVLSSDGGMLGFPADGRRQLLQPGESYVFRGSSETFQSQAPLGALDHVLVFGTRDSNPVHWHLLTDEAPARAAGGRRTGLEGALDRYFRPGARAAVSVRHADEDTTWTLSALSVKVEAGSNELGTAGSGRRNLEDACDPDLDCGASSGRQSGSGGRSGVDRGDASNRGGLVRSRGGVPTDH